MRFCAFAYGIAIATALSVMPLEFVSVLAQADYYPSAMIAQSRAPRLLGAHTTADGVALRYARYSFTIELPPTALNPVQKIQLQQRTGTEQIEFRLAESSAFLGTSRRRGEALGLTEVVADPETAKLTLTLARAVQPGETVTVQVRPERNPRYGGEYGFGVTVFPTLDATEGLYLGPGRLRFYERDWDFPWP